MTRRTWLFQGTNGGAMTAGNVKDSTGAVAASVVVNGAGSTATYSTDHPYPSGTGAKFAAASAANSVVRLPLDAASPSLAISLGIWYSGTPPTVSSLSLLNARHSAGINAQVKVTTAGRLQLQSANGGATYFTSTAALTAGFWRVDLYLTRDTATTGTGRIQYSAGDSATPVETSAAITTGSFGTTDFAAYDVGRIDTTAAAYTVYVTNVQAEEGRTSFIGPLSTGWASTPTQVTSTLSATGGVTFTGPSTPTAVTAGRQGQGAVTRAQPSTPTAGAVTVTAGGTKTVDDPGAYSNTYTDLYALASGGAAVFAVTAGPAAGGVAAVSVGSPPTGVFATRSAGGDTARTGAGPSTVTVTPVAVGFVPRTGASTTVPATATVDAAGRARYTGPATNTGLTATTTAGGATSGGSGDSTPTTVTTTRPVVGATGLAIEGDTQVMAAQVAGGAARYAVPSTPLTVTTTRPATGGGVVVPGAATLPVTATTTAALRTGYVGASTNTRVTATRGTVGLTQYGYGTHRFTTARLTATGVTQSVPTSHMADILWRGLPTVYQAADMEPAQVNRQRILYRYIAAMLSGLHETEVTAERIAGGDLTDPVRADDAWIPWLAQVMGVDGATVTDMRARILALSVAPSVGSASYLIALTRSLLTGTQSIEYIPQPPWGILVRVVASELGLVGGTTGGLQDAIMATGRVPTGFTLTITTTGATWGEVDSVTAMWSDQPVGKQWDAVDASGI